MTAYHLAQLNIARMLAPADHPIMADFMDALDHINALGEQTPGFVWRLKGEDGNATAFRVFEDPLIIVNLTVWEDIDSLFQYAYYTEHADFFRRRREWFHKESVPMYALWWIAAGTEPTLQEARARLEYLQAHGPTPYAFGFRDRFTPEEAESYARVGV